VYKPSAYILKYLTYLLKTYILTKEQKITEYNTNYVSIHMQILLYVIHFLQLGSALQCVNGYVLLYLWTPERMFTFAVVYSSTTN